LPRDTNG